MGRTGALSHRSAPAAVSLQLQRDSSNLRPPLRPFGPCPARQEVGRLANFPAHFMLQYCYKVMSSWCGHILLSFTATHTHTHAALFATFLPTRRPALVQDLKTLCGLCDICHLCTCSLCTWMFENILCCFRCHKPGYDIIAISQWTFLPTVFSCQISRVTPLPCRPPRQTVTMSHRLVGLHNNIY